MRVFNSFLLVVGLCGQCTLGRAQQIDVTKYGAKPNSATDATPAVLRAIAATAGLRNATLVFPHGTYDFWPDAARPAHYFISNHDALNTRAVAMPLENLEGLTLDGQGSTLIFHGVMMPLALVHTKHALLKNFTIDYATPHLLLTQVSSSDFQSVRIDVLPGQEYSVVGGQLHLHAEQWTAPATASLEFDPETMTVARGAKDNFQFSAVRVAEAERGHLELTGMRVLPKVGNILLLRAVDRPAPTIWASESSDVTVQDVTVRSALGMAFLGQKSADIHLNHFDVRLAPGAHRFITTNADAVHFSNCRGTVTVENGFYENMLDDGINVHGSYLRIAKLLGPNSLLLEWGHPQTFGFTFAVPGEVLQFRKVAALVPYLSARATSVSAPDEHHVQITFSTPLSADVQVNDYVDNMEWRPKVVYRNNTVRRTRSRAGLFSTTGGVVIEGNTFEQTSGAALLFPGGSGKWFESVPTSDVIVRHNVFRKTNLGGSSSAIMITAAAAPPADPQSFLHRNVAIENNSFEFLSKGAIDASSVDDLRILNNHVLASEGEASSTTQLTVVRSRCLRIEGNDPPIQSQATSLEHAMSCERDNAGAP